MNCNDLVVKTRMYETLIATDVYFKRMNLHSIKKEDDDDDENILSDDNTKFYNYHNAYELDDLDHDDLDHDDPDYISIIDHDDSDYTSIIDNDHIAYNNKSNFDYDNNRHISNLLLGLSHDDNSTGRDHNSTGRDHNDNSTGPDHNDNSTDPVIYNSIDLNDFDSNNFDSNNFDCIISDMKNFKQEFLEDDIEIANYDTKINYSDPK